MAEEEKPDIGKNCAACKKVLNRKKRYYRNNAYYCNLNCFKKKIEADKKKKEEEKE